VVCCYRFDVDSDPAILIRVKELLCDDTYLSKVANDRKSGFTKIEVLDLI
jgi:hypothetical protein